MPTAVVLTPSVPTAGVSTAGIPTALAPAPHALTAHLDGGAVLLDLQTRAYFQLNATAAVVWQSVEAREDRGAAIARLVGAFDVDAVSAAAGYDALVGELRARALVVPA